MNSTEQFERTLLLALAVWAARALRCLDQAGLLDEESRASVHTRLARLFEDAETIPDRDTVLAHLQMVAQILPPPNASATAS